MAKFLMGVLIALTIVLSISVTCRESNSLDESKIAYKFRSAFHVPKALDFARFRHRFGKQYRSSVELIARQKIYLARAFKAFVSAIEFKYRRSNFYLKINHMSDWTDEERSKAMIRTLPVVDKTPAVDPKALEKTLSEVVANRDESRLLNDIAEELTSDKRQGSKVNRKRRDVSGTGEDFRQVDPDELVSVSDDEPTTSNESEQFFMENPSMSLKRASDFTLIPGYSYLKKWLTWGSSRKPTESAGKSRDSEEDEVYIDLRANGCLAAPKDQGTCGCCYIFATVSLLEYTHCVETGKLVTFSEKYILDCSSLVPDALGCDGGLTEAVVQFSSQFGLDLAHHYHPYNAKQATCPIANALKESRIEEKRPMGHIRMDQNELLSIPYEQFDYWLERSPILVYLHVPPVFHDFGGGVHNPKRACRRTGESHSMVAIGKGRRDGHDYYILRNSFSNDWGEAGYYNLDQRSVSYCLKPDRNQILASTLEGRNITWSSNDDKHEPIFSLLESLNSIEFEID